MDLPTAETGTSSVGNTKDLGCERSLRYIIYGGFDRKVNDAITFEQSNFSEIHESKIFEVSY